MASTMYRQDKLDRESVASRLSMFRDQIERRLAGEITEDQFRPMRRMNGVHLRDHAYTLRVSIPYGVLSSRQLRVLAHVARVYDRGYAHFTADRNVEFHWPALSDTPAALTDLASVGLYSTEAGSGSIPDSGVGRLADAPHGQSDHASVAIPLDGARDLSGSRMEALANLAEKYGSGELQVGDGREIVLPLLSHADLDTVHSILATSGFENDGHSYSTPFMEAHNAGEAEAA